MSELDDLFADWGITDATVIIRECCDTSTTVGARDYTEAICTHGCCLLWSCGFCGAPDGSCGPAGCPCRCGEAS